MSQNINDLLSEVANSRKRKKELYIMIAACDDWDVLAKNYTGKLNPEILENLLNGRINHNTRSIAKWAIEHFGDESSISKESFKKIKKLSHKYKRQLFSSMAHIKLPFYQLWEIRNNDLSFEQFDTLLHVMCNNECFTLQDIEFLISESNLKKETIKSVIDYFINHYGINDKYTFALEVTEDKN